MDTPLLVVEPPGSHFTTKSGGTYAPGAGEVITGVAEKTFKCVRRDVDRPYVVGAARRMFCDRPIAEKCVAQIGKATVVGG